MTVSRTELATEARLVLDRLYTESRSYTKRIQIARAQQSANKAWKALQIAKTAEDTAFNLTKNNLEALVSALNRLTLG